MSADVSELKRGQRVFFAFLVRRFMWGTIFSMAVATALLYFDLGKLTSIMLRSPDRWLWLMILLTSIWVTVTGITIAIGLMYLGEWRDPPADE